MFCWSRSETEESEDLDRVRSEPARIFAERKREMEENQLGDNFFKIRFLSVCLRQNEAEGARLELGRSDRQ